MSDQAHHSVLPALYTDVGEKRLKIISFYEPAGVLIMN